ncbi:hypothetical protein EI94DRAFT_1748142 [Lactarius quietus]|nr:hypothetical protein EI94DRAFT_1748142 [Lactarius quietus]
MDRISRPLALCLPHKGHHLPLVSLPSTDTGFSIFSVTWLDQMLMASHSSFCSVSETSWLVCVPSPETMLLSSIVVGWFFTPIPLMAIARVPPMLLMALVRSRCLYLFSKSVPFSDCRLQKYASHSCVAGVLRHPMILLETHCHPTRLVL